MKNYLSILILSLLAVTLMSVIILINKNIRQAREIDRLETNLSEYGRKISTLKLTTGELREEITKGNRQLAVADSVLRDRGKKISQLERLIATKVAIVDTDTTFLPIERSVPVYLEKPGVYFKTNFASRKSCMNIEGFILSTDPDPSIAITKREVEVSVYYMDTKRRWYQFWKPKQEKIVYSDCGDVTILETNKK